jgi:hypothetical protein
MDKKMTRLLDQKSNAPLAKAREFAARIQPIAKSRETSGKR